jgi:gliding motility-associated lipoprotein GldH
MAIIRNIKYFLAISAFLLAGCSREDSIVRIKTFDNSIWERYDYLNFDFPITDESAVCDVVVMLRFTGDFPFEALLINFVMTLPSGEERIKDYRITLKEKDGTLKGEAKSGYHEQFFTIRENMRIVETGNLNIEIENLTPKYFTPGIVELGVLLEPSK